MKILLFLLSVLAASASTTAVVSPGSTPVVSTGRIVNISSRAMALMGDPPIIEGFCLPEPTRVLIRGIGPGLQRFLGPSSIAMAMPSVILRDGNGHTIAVSTAAGELPQAMATQVRIDEILGGVGLPASAGDAVIDMTLPAGLYTAQLLDPLGDDIGLIEAYIATSGSSSARFTNISTRGPSHSNLTDGSMIVGFSVRDGQVVTLLRAAGPALRQFGLTDGIPDPTIALRNSKGYLLTPDSGPIPTLGGWVTAAAGWDTDPGSAKVVSQAAKQVGAFTFERGSADAATVFLLGQGAWTMEVKSASYSYLRTRWETVVEVYDAFSL